MGKNRTTAVRGSIGTTAVPDKPTSIAPISTDVISQNNMAVWLGKEKILILKDLDILSHPFHLIKLKD
jgi:hypothetical protein